MSFRGMKAVLLACSGIAALIAATADANAGGLAVREQSAWGQGSSFAGVAAGGSLSAMFWNPATMTQQAGFQSESVLSGILPYSANTPTSAAGLGTSLALGGTGNVAHAAIVPSIYYSYQFNDKLWLGLSVNSPFGLSETFPDNWAGRQIAAGGENLTTYNATPSIAYKLNDWISVGAGVQIQYAKLNFSQGTALGLTNQLAVNGAGWGYGFTAGVTLTPTPTTMIGLGWRSGMNQKFNGTINANAACFLVVSCGSANGIINVPDIVSLGLRQRLSQNWTAMGTVEWSHWGRTTNVAILTPNGVQVTGAGNPLVIPLNYQDGWFFSVGAEYQWNPALALRAGVAFEKSPVTDTVRNPVIPDNDRLWLSLGGTYKYSEKITLDLAYSHVFVKSAPITIVDASNPGFLPGITGTGTYTGTVDSHVDIISVALKYRWDNPAPAVKQGYFKAK
jgi:long-chain fatty acid transport protein